MRLFGLALIRIAPVRAVLGLAFAVLVFALASCTSTGSPSATAGHAPRNIIILFADGAASTQWEFGRYSSHQLRKRPFVTTDTVFRQGAFGLITTHSANSMVADSAATATAMSTGFKTDNFKVGVTPDGAPVKTFFEAARTAGKRLGLVTTAQIYDASPAAFSVHAANRGEFQRIVDQYAALEPEVLLGGGADYFLPASSPGGRRKDGRNVLAELVGKGYTVARNSAELKAAGGTKLLGLFADGPMGYELDRNPALQPTLAEMAEAALRVLSQSSPNGFVLFVENENTDDAGHDNDIAALMHALWGFDNAVEVALAFQRRNPDTLVIVTSDHETGGLSITYALRDLIRLSSQNRIYAGEPHLQSIGRITLSVNAAARRLGHKPSSEALDQLLVQYFPGFQLDDDLREVILRQRPVELNFTRVTQNALGRMIARQTGFYWGTAGHTTEPVAVGAIGPGAELFRGYQDNTDFGKHLHRLIQGK